jgi:hypothetical protein
MEFSIQTIIVVAVFIFISLLALFAIILSFINWINLRRSLGSLSDIPQRLYLPFSTEEQDTMRSWFIDGNEAGNYIGEISVQRYPPSLNGKSTCAGNITDSINLPEARRLYPYPGNRLKPLNRRASRALQNPDDSVREANTFMFQVTEAIQRFEEDPEGKDELSGIDSNDLPVKK